MKLEHRIRQAETRLFARRRHANPTSPSSTSRRHRCGFGCSASGAGPSLVMLHGVSLAAAVWAPWLADLSGYRAHLVELPGHGLSGPVPYRAGAVRDHTLTLIDDLFDALGLATAPVVGHSLGGMFALWYAAARPGRIVSLVAIGDPGRGAARGESPDAVVAPDRPGARPGRPAQPHRPGRCIGGCSAKASAPPLLRPHPTSCSTCFASPPGARETPDRGVAHARHQSLPPSPRRERHDRRELRQITAPTMFCWGPTTLPEPSQARPAIAKIPGRVLHEVPGGHGPWLEDPAGCATIVTTISRLRDSRLFSLGGTTPPDPPRATCSGQPSAGRCSRPAPSALARLAEYLVGRAGTGAQRAFHQAGPVPGGVLPGEMHPAGRARR